MLRGVSYTEEASPRPGRLRLVATRGDMLKGTSTRAVGIESEKNMKIKPEKKMTDKRQRENE